MDFNRSKAELIYGDGAFTVVEHGTYVICYVSNREILLSDLKYWSVARQEAYYDAEQSLKREKEVNQI